MRLARLSERLMAMDDAAWARHANPWSGWSRVLILPLLALALWSRIWLGWGAAVPTALVLIWTAVNPRAFPPPRRLDSWMSRGVLGERLWLRAGRAAPEGRSVGKPAAASGPAPPAPADRALDRVAARHAPILRALSVASGLGVALLLGGVAILDPGLTLAGLFLAMGAKLWFLDRMIWLYREAGG